VQPSAARAFTDDEFREAGILVAENISDCDIFLGIKEVPTDQLIAGKTYLFFSHTFKKQAHNRKLLKALVENNNRLIDYELLTDQSGARLVAFGRYAGIVGAYKTLRAWGIITKNYDVKAAWLCRDKAEMEAELDAIEFEKPIKIVLTGKGRVAHGAREILDRTGIKRVSPAAFLQQTFAASVYTDLSSADYHRKKDGSVAGKDEFHTNPERFESAFAPFYRVADMYIACHFWDKRAPLIFTKEEAAQPDFNIRMIGDISCDVGGPIPTTLRTSILTDPFYGYNKTSGNEVPLGSPNSIGVMSVDNLPCDLPRDASVDFGHALIDKVLPHFFNGDAEGVLERATQCADGQLTPKFAYLQDFIEGKE